MTSWRESTDRLCRQPFKLLSNRVWRTYRGGAMIDQWQGKPRAEDGSCPEEWIASVTEARNPAHVHKDGAGLSFIAAETANAVRLRDLIGACPEAMLGSGHLRRYGLDTAVLVKILDAAERLTIQVHPDRTTAKTLFGSPYGKTEAWYILGGRAMDGELPAVYLGFKPGMNRSRWREMFQNQDSVGMLESLHRFDVKPGQVFFVGGGIPHAIGAGCFLLEIQEPTDYTIRPERTTPSGYRISDEACHQGLGFDAMFDCFHYDGCSREEALRRWQVHPKEAAADTGTKRLTLIDSETADCFGLESIETAAAANLPHSGQFFILVVVKNGGTLRWIGPGGGQHHMQVCQGDQVFVPADAGPLTLRAAEAEPVKAVCCYPPAAKAITSG